MRHSQIDAGIAPAPEQAIPAPDTVHSPATTPAPDASGTSASHSLARLGWRQTVVAGSSALAAAALAGGCAADAPPPAVQAQAPAAQQLWCPAPEGYYPEVQQCAGGWVRRAPAHAASDATPPVLVIPVQPPAGVRP